MTPPPDRGAERTERGQAILSRLLRIPAPLRALLVVALLEVVCWTAVTAPFLGPDEPAHFGYAQHLAETQNKPAYEGVAGGNLSTEAGSALFQMNLYPLIGVGSARPFWSDADVREWERVERSLSDDAGKNGGGPNAVAKNPPLYYAYQAIPYTAASGLDVFDRMFVMRLATGIFFLVTVGLTWLLAAEVFRSPLARTVATAVVALSPVAAFMAGVVNPDTLLAMFFAAFVLLALRLIRLGPSTGRIAALVAVVFGGLLTHGRALPLLASLPVAIALAWWRHRPPVPRAVRWGIAAVTLLVVAALVALGSGAYGGELNIGRNFSLGQFASFVWQFYLPPLPFMDARLGPDYGFRQVFVEQYLGSFGALDVRYERDTYRLIGLGVIAGLIWLAVAIVARRREIRPRWDAFALLAFVVVVTVFFLHVVSYRALAGGGGDPLIVGRYLLGLTPVAGLAGAFLVQAGGMRRGPWIAAGIVGVCVLLQLGGLGASLARFYG